jgi:hypothetical protein
LKLHRIRVDLTIAQCADVCLFSLDPLQLEEIFDSTLPLSTFRSAVMCKHSKARQERRAAAAKRAADPPSRYDDLRSSVRLDVATEDGMCD